MYTFLLVIHLLLATAMVGVILLQRSEGGGLGIGGGSMGAMMTIRGAGNLLTRVTAILAAGFMLTSLTLAIWSANPSRSLLDNLPVDDSSGLSPPILFDGPDVPDTSPQAIPADVPTDR